ncbi:hypothetical protein BDQ12DRAFT_324393 [Crucibulum laeve]|uniref:Uncharacterized protein n=1 Tax=Crucibulum laeve TaxID=68775 RepID=A0A5C3LPQ2_9AGAR|nr:hypothetical protein BDQ12DRAFT_324393 [Crucibulum laeve]
MSSSNRKLIFLLLFRPRQLRKLKLTSNANPHILLWHLMCELGWSSGETRCGFLGLFDELFCRGWYE